MGLSISQSIVESMGGNIDVKSEKNVGSEFSFVISLKKEIIAPTVVEPKEFMKEKHDDTISILVAEDNELNQLLITSILDKEGVTTHAFNNTLRNRQPQTCSTVASCNG